MWQELVYLPTRLTSLQSLQFTAGFSYIDLNIYCFIITVRCDSKDYGMAHLFGFTDVIRIPVSVLLVRKRHFRALHLLYLLL